MTSFPERFSMQLSEEIAQIINHSLQLINGACLQRYDSLILGYRLTIQFLLMDNTFPSGNTSQGYSGELAELKDKVTQHRNLIPTSFFLVVVFFFFSFCNFRCNGTKVASLKGINLVTGTHLKTSVGGALNALDAMGGQAKKAGGEKIPSNVWAVIAFFSAITGFIVFYRRKRKEALWGTLLGAIGFICLVALRWAIKNAVDDQSGGMVTVETSFAFGYWASLLSFLVAGGVSFLRWKAEQLSSQPSNSIDPSPTPIHINVITQSEHDNLS